MRKPKKGDYVEVTWLDSGMDYRASFTDRGHPLQLSVARGKVLSCEPDPDLDLPKKWDPTTLVLIYDSAGPTDDHSSLGKIWWSAIVACRWLVLK